MGGMTRYDSGLHWADWAMMAAYMISMIGIGWLAGRRAKSLDEYFIGGRNIGSFAAGISLVATLLSTISYLAYPGEVIAHGTGFLWQIVALPVVFIVVGYMLIPHIMSLPVRSGYELLEGRLGPGMRTIAASIFLLIRLIWMAFILHTACTAIGAMIGVSREWLMFAMAIVTLIYTAQGGIRAVVWTDIAQFFVLLGGAIFTFFFLMYHGNLTIAGLVREGWDSTLQTPLFSFDPTVRTSAASWAISIGVWWIATCGSDQVAMQRFFTNRNAAAARRSVLVNLVGSTSSVVVLAAVGLALLHYFRLHPGELPEELRDLGSSGDRIFPYFISHGLPVGLSGLVIAALLAAAMSSLSSGLNSVTTVLTEDFLGRARSKPDEEGSGARRKAQLVTLLIGAGTLAMAYPLKFAKETIIGLSARLTEPLTGPLFGLFAVAFFIPRANGFTAAIGFACGLGVGYFLAFGHLLLGRPDGFSFLWISPSAIVATLAIAFVASRLRRGTSPD